jgi:hypothetical protein
VVSFTLRQVTAIVDGPAYKVTNQVVSATDSDVYAFVFNAASQKFSHYATAADMQQWPTSLALAQVTNAEFYRLDTVVRTWPSVEEMNDDLADTVRRIQRLADELNQVNGSLTIDRTTVIQGA